MLSDKFIKEYHMKETVWYFGEERHPFNAIILCDKQKGISIKPYWDEEEKQHFIELFVAFGNTREFMQKEIAKSTFCFANMPKKVKVANARKAIARGNLDVLDTFGSSPVCPFA